MDGFEIYGADGYENVDCGLLEYGSSLFIETAASSGKVLKTFQAALSDTA
jgi:hypothetical protein